MAVGVAAGFVAITNSVKWRNILKYIQTKKYLGLLICKIEEEVSSKLSHKIGTIQVNVILLISFLL